MIQYRAKEKRQLFYDEFLDKLESDKYYACYRTGYLFGKMSLLREKRRMRSLTIAERYEWFAIQLIQNSYYGVSGPKCQEMQKKNTAHPHCTQETPVRNNHPGESDLLLNQMPVCPISIILSENVTPGKKISFTVLKTRGGEK